MKRSALILCSAAVAFGQERVSEEFQREEAPPVSQYPSFELSLVEEEVASQRFPFVEHFELERPPSSYCCQPKIPACCTLGTGNLWTASSGDLAEQPAVYNPQCVNSVDFGMAPTLTGGQPFCHSIELSGASLITSAALHITMTSNPPCGVTSDRFCLSTGDGKEWCTLLEPGTNSFCLHLEDLGLVSAAMSPLLIRAAHHTTVNSMRFHINMCLPPSPSIPVPSINHDFTNDLTSTTGSPTMTWVSASSADYFVGGPEGTAANFAAPASYLTATSHASQDGGEAMSMAIWLYFDSEVNLAYQGLPIVTKYGSYRWMFNPGQEWVWHHVHLGPGFGDLVHANPAYVGSDYRIPIKKWLCMAVTIDVDSTAGTTTLHYYQNGKLWAAPTVRNTVYNMDGTADLYINADNSQFWPGKVDKFTLWKQVLTAKQVSEYCNCAP